MKKLIFIILSIFAVVSIAHAISISNNNWTSADTAGFSTSGTITATNGVITNLTTSNTPSFLTPIPRSSGGTGYSYAVSPAYFIDNTAHSIYSSSSTTGLAWTLSPLNEVTFLTTTINGGDFSILGIMKVGAAFTFANSANSKSLKTYYGGSSALPTLNIVNNAVGRTVIEVFSRGTNSQIWFPAIGSSGVYGVSSGLPFYTAIDTSVTHTLVITAQTTTESLKTSSACSAATVTAICGSTPTVTCTSTANGYNTGEYAEVTGATPTFYNQAVALIKTALTNTIVYCASGATATTTAQPSFSRYSPITLESCHIQILR